MIGNLNKSQMEHVLASKLVGRLACIDNTRPYIIPLTYCYHQGYIYAHGKDGMKISIMRKNPSVCFLVDDIISMSCWRSVIVWGNFEEIKEPSLETEASQLLKERFEPYITSESTRKPSQYVHPPQIVEKDLKAIIFRIKITEMTGRFEKPDAERAEIYT
jgi:uncharacterized protein